MITVGSHWETGPWRAEPREIVIDKGDVQLDDAVVEATEIGFHFLDREQTTSCSRSAFLRTYREITT